MIATNVRTKFCRSCGAEFVPRDSRRVTCSDECWIKVASDISTMNARRKSGLILNDFLPANAEENVFYIWVPSPEEIEEKKKEIREGKVLLGSW